MSRLLHALFYTCALLFTTLTAQAGSFSNIFIFGDSLSDTGNLASVAGDFPSPPFYDNRVSNGPVAVEHLAEFLGLTAEPSLHLIGPVRGTNYAVASARAVNLSFIDLPTQVGAFLLANGGAAPSDALYVLFIGGNDIRDARDAADKEEAEGMVEAAAEAAGEQLRTLILAGARSVLVINAPNIGAIPETRLLAQLTGNKKLVKRARKLTKKYNEELAEQVEEIEEDFGLDLVEYDLFRLLGSLIEESAGLGYINDSDACFSTQLLIFNDGCEFGANFDRYVFFDEIHPTAVTHQRAGRAFFSFVPAM